LFTSQDKYILRILRIEVHQTSAATCYVRPVFVDAVVSRNYYLVQPTKFDDDDDDV